MNREILYHVPIVGPFADPRLLAELARAAEDSGWDAVFLEDYIVHYLGKGKLPVCDPWIALTAIALATNQANVGTLPNTGLLAPDTWSAASGYPILRRVRNGVGGVFLILSNGNVALL